MDATSEHRLRTRGTAASPGLLSAADWKATMAGLDKHFGTDAGLDTKPAAEIAAWLEKNASKRIESGAKEPRLTTTAWFKREHREVAAKTWQDSRVKSPANCAACHKGADQGRYGEREIDIPGVGPYRERD
ncbi:MAG: hypothetical protein HGA75_19360 [Thiobacillus sp.]|nr:hypothetical protein [Thiobacillus sp.]